MKTLEKIIDLIQQKGVDEKAFLKDIDMNATALSDWKSGRNKSYKKHIVKIADYFNVSTDYLLGKESKLDKWYRENTTPRGEVIIKPVLGRVSAGNGILAEEDIIGYQAVDPKYLSDEYFLLKVSGDSMSPRLDDGDIAIIKKQPSVDCGNVGVFTIDGEDGIIKKAVYGDNYIELHSFNPYYPVRIFKDSEVLRVEVMGKIVESIRKW